ncbi:hypothetical protein WQ57_24080 [Mesobacillus campisalis]|uniref:Uncharacterized protein n=1 Tax=Mesobacillus campisalis TaxID=1408103 RepID=A0A0M2SHF1_9BACI|nr:hypothetical protein [Mesobacillus campisalis]KKK33036.1 hypothetical protein WQ57_24080 [Mesobacillus campisalis]
MHPLDEDSAALCKKIEEELNRTYRCVAGTVPFMTLAGAALEAHLDQVERGRKRCKAMLDSLGLPCSDEVAAIAKRLIKNEARLDQLEEHLYGTMLELMQSRTRLSQLSAELAELANS